MSNKTSKFHAEERAYHHGELPEVLMSLAVEAIKERGTEALSLRALARAAGVSATAPYRHFPSKRCLLAGVATRGFNDLTQRMRETLESHDNREERFIAMGLAYVDFAVANPVPYQLMFGSVIADFSDYDELQQASEAAFAQLLEELDRLISEQQLNTTALILSGVVWAGVHGMASLILNGGAPPERANDPTAQLSAPGQSIRLLRTDTERAMRLMFSHLIGSHPAS